MKKILLWLIIFLPFELLAQSKILLQPEMVTNLTGWGNANLLVDEQDLAGDPASGKGNKVNNRWFPGWSQWYYPSSAIIDLRAEYQISDIFIHDGTGTGNISVFSGSPSGWKLLFNSKLQQYLTWNRQQVNIKTRFIQIQINEMGAVPEEIVIYGKKASSDISEPIAVSHPKPLMKDFIGINGFIDDPLEVSRAVNFVREYHNWGWNEKFQDKSRFSPSYPGWNFDSYYKRMKEAGITVVPCIKESPSWIAEKNEEKPVRSGLNTEDPKSYKEKAGFMFQYAARYGAKAVNKNLLKVDSNQEAKTGLNYLKYYEDWNEQDKWWLGRKAYFTPFEYAAMASANYDGHKGALGPGYGIKNADPGAVLVMGGLTGLNLEYIKAMHLWAQYNRGGDFPADVINFHPYSNDGGGQSGTATTGISPEQDNLKEKLKPLVDYRNRFLPGKEIWITEFGYDVNQGSPQKAPVIGNFSAEEVQAMWLVRSYLEMAAAGIDRAAMYMVRDAGEITSTVKYSTSGLTEGKNIRKRQSWYYVKTLNHILGNYRFESEIPGQQVRNYKFKENKSGNTIYMIWSPSSKQTVIKDYTFKLPEGSQNYKVIGFKNNDEDGDTLQVTTRPSGTVKLDVSEKPVFLVVGLQENYLLEDALIPLSGNPTEGTFQGAGINGSELDIMEAGAGQHQLSYTFVDSHGYTSTTSTTFNIHVSTGSKDFLQESGIEAYPNPANTSTTIKYSLEKESTVEITLFDTYGKEIQLSGITKASAGIYSFQLNKEALKIPSGMYLLKVSINKEVKMVKVIFN